jgi:putative phosphoesterase
MSARVIGLISDTHGLLRPEVFDAFQGVSHILHAGDVGGDEILDELATIAPVDAVTGNTDSPGDPRLVASLTFQVDDVRIFVTHGHELGSPTPKALLQRYAGDVIVYGHTHRQSIVRAGDRWVINPGAAGHRRFELLPSVARLSIDGSAISVELVDLPY